MNFLKVFVDKWVDIGYNKNVPERDTKNYSRTDLKREANMAYKLLNPRKENIELKNLDDNTRASVEAIQQGEYTICCNWEEVENLLDCFDSDNDFDNWQIEGLSNGMFAILPENTTTQQKNKFEKLISE